MPDSWKACFDSLAEETRKLIYIAYCVYKDEGRPLTPEDVFGILQVKKRGVLPKMIFDMLNEFEIPEESMSNIISRSDAQKLEDEVGTLYGQFWQQDKKAKSRRELLAGLPLRVRWPRLVYKMLKWNDREIRPEEAMVIRAMHKYCRTGDGREFPDESVKRFAQYQIFDGIGCASSRIQTILKDKDHKYTKLVDEILDQDERYPEFFAKTAHERLKKFAKDFNFREPRLEMAIASRHDVESATTGIGSLTMTRTADSSHQRNEPGTKKVNIYEDIEHTQDPPQPNKSDTGEVDSDEDTDFPQRPTEPSPSPTGVSGNNPKGKGKEKQTDVFKMYTNQSSSSSQPSEAPQTPPAVSGNDAKGKGKDSGKRPRESTPSSSGQSPASKGKKSRERKGKEPRNK